MNAFNAWKQIKRSAHGYFYCLEAEKVVSTWILLLPGSGESGQHMDTFIALKQRKRSAHGNIYAHELRKRSVHEYLY
jgi:hypothetical protein